MTIDLQLTTHFNLKEWFKTSHNQAQLIRDFENLSAADRAEIIDNIRSLAQKLEIVRQRNGKSMPVESGWRSWRVHSAIYAGLKQRPPNRSAHLEGKAGDFHYRDLSPGIVSWLEKTWNGGFGRYSWGIHLDIGPRRRW